jgi:Domain of unknown function (DUF1929)
MKSPLSRRGRRSRKRSRPVFGGTLPGSWRSSKRVRAAASAVALVVPIVVVAGSSASAGVNLIVNPNLTQAGTSMPVCWQKSGSGSIAYSIGTTTKAVDPGGRALEVSVSKYSSGQALALMTMNQSCAPTVTPGHEYNLGVHYLSSTPDAVIELYRHDESKGWVFWEDVENLPVSGTYKTATVRTPVIPTGTDQISWGVSVYGKGTVITDDYSMSDATVASSKAVCTAGVACRKGAWQVLPFPSPVRSIHTVVLMNGKILLIAGSGNDPDEFAAGTFESAVYDPSKGTFQMIPTPDDFFCAGHIQLANGNVLILGGNKAYQTATRDYEGLNTSYIFDPLTDKYVRENNLNVGHWYPSATELGNGDIISFGGLDQTGNGTTATEYFKYANTITDSNPDSKTDGKWLATGQINEDNGFWGLYPSMILMQSGQLFYSGSHVFGNNETPVGDNGGVDPNGAGKGNGGAGILNVKNILKPASGAAGDPITKVNGLQDNPGGPAGTDMTDQSMSVLLPPAQSQQVFLAGGGNINYLKSGVRTTNLINLLSKTTPKYTPGPLLPRGTLSNGKEESTTQGKMYPSMVLLPNGQVFETGGGLINREDPVYEASMINPAKLEANPTSEAAYTPMAVDPVPRTYHSQSFLLPDGRVMSIGNNPGDGSFDMRISVFSPPYLFDGARPQITGVQAAAGWTYGKAYNITTNSSIVSAELIRPAAVTHQSDPNQRYVALGISGSGKKLKLSLTNNANIAPPGWYMLFVTNANGVPSVAKWVHVG